jgi:4-carboxymuconolactone decarboxylase
MAPPSESSSALAAYVAFFEHSRKPFAGLDAHDTACCEFGAIMAGPASARTLERAARSAAAVGVPLAFLDSLVMHVSAYAGLAAAEWAMGVLDGLARHDPVLAGQPRFVLPEIAADRAGRADFGFAFYRRFHAARPAQQAPRFEALSPEYYPGGMELMGYSFADPALTLRSREIASIGCLAALGCCPDPLLFHLEVGLREGITREQLAAMLMIVQVHAGVPRTHAAAAMAAQVIASREPHRWLSHP